MAIKTRIATTIKENKFANKILIKIKTLATKFVGLLKNEIAKIFSNQFKLMNFYKFCLMKGWNDLYWDQIHVNKRILKICKVIGSYKDYRISNILWSENFLNYMIILIALFDLIISTFYLALTNFYQEIIKLFTIYKWQKRSFS